MTEAEWLTATEFDFDWDNPQLWNRLTDRRCRLFAVACCRRIWDLIPYDSPKQLIEVFERATEDSSSEAEWEQFCDTYEFPSGDTQTEKYALSAVVTCRFDRHNRLVDTIARYCSLTVSCHLAPQPAAALRDTETRAQLELLRDIFGNPFRPVTLDPRWRTETVVALATGIYSERAFDRMPILADALEDAGCDHADILTHCRGDGPHVRGCWVVDLLLGKE